MSDDHVETVERTQSGLFIAILGFAALASAGALFWSYTLENRLEKSQTALANAQQQNDKLAEGLNETNAKLRVTSETLGQSVGLTQRQLEARASEFSSASKPRRPASKKSSRLLRRKQPSK